MIKPQEQFGPHGGVHPREYAARKNEFLHLMNLIVNTGALRSRFGNEHVGRAACAWDPAQYTPPSVPPGQCVETASQVFGHGVLYARNFLAYNLDSEKTLFRTIIDNNTPAGLTIALQIYQGGGWTRTAVLETAIAGDDPHLFQAESPNYPLLCTGYGPVYAAIPDQGFVAANGVDGYGGDPTNRCIVGKLPNPRSFFMYKGTMPVWCGIRLPDNEMYDLSSSIETPTIKGAVKNTGGDLTPGTTYYFKMTAINDEGETGASAEVSVAMDNPPVIKHIRGHDLAVKSIHLTWEKIKGATRYRIYIGTTPGGQDRYVDVFGAMYMVTTYDFAIFGAGDWTPGVPPDESDNARMRMSNLAGREVWVGDPMTAYDTRVILQADRFFRLRSKGPGDAGDEIVTGMDAFGGMVIFCHRSIHFATGVNVDSFRVRELSGTVGCESPDLVKMCGDGVIRFVDTNGGFYDLPGAVAPIKVSTPLDDYFELPSLSGSDPFILNKLEMKKAHAVDDEENGGYIAWLPFSLQNHRTRDEPLDTAFCYKYRVGEKDPKAFFPFGKAAYVDNDGDPNRAERGFAFRSSAFLDAGEGKKRLYLGGYDGYTSVQTAGYNDASEDFMLQEGRTPTIVRFSRGSYPGMEEGTDLVGATLEMLDDRSEAERAAGTDPVYGCVSIAVTNPGSGYTAATATVTGTGLVGATATVQVADGIVTGLTVTNPGTGGTDVSVAIVGDGAGAAAEGTLGVIGSVVGGQTRAVTAHRDIMLKDCNTAWSEFVGVGVTSATDTEDKIKGSASAKFTLPAQAPGVAFKIATSALVEETWVMGGSTARVRGWLWSSVERAAGNFEILLDIVAACAGVPWKVAPSPFLPAATWVQMSIDISAIGPDTIISIGVRKSAAGTTDAADILKLDAFDYDALKGTDLTVGIGWKDAYGTAVVPDNEALMRVYWPCVWRIVPLPLGLKLAPEFNKRFVGMELRARLDGDTTIDLYWSSEPDGWSRERIVQALPAVVSGQWVGSERWTPYWTWANLLGQKEIDDGLIVFHPPNIGKVMRLIMQGAGGCNIFGWQYLAEALEQTLR